MANFIARLTDRLRRMGVVLLSKAQEEFNARVKSGDYDLSGLILKHEWNKTSGGYKSRDWLRTQILNNKEYQHKQLMEAGKLYLFRYINPKTKDILDYFDTEPLVLCLGHYISKSGSIVEMGINLHFLPLKVRQSVLIKVFDMYRRAYKGEMYRTPQKTVPVKWQQIAAPLEQYGAAFAFRSYLPERRQLAVEFKYEDWHNAVFIPSTKYSGIAFDQLRTLWAQFVQTHSFKKLSQERFEDMVAAGRWAT